MQDTGCDAERRPCGWAGGPRGVLWTEGAVALEGAVPLQAAGKSAQCSRPRVGDWISGLRAAPLCTCLLPVLDLWAWLLPAGSLSPHHLGSQREGLSVQYPATLPPPNPHWDPSCTEREGGLC